jgi:NADPH:quinone reductase
VRAIVVTRFGGSDVLELQELHDLDPGAGEILVDIDFAGVNYRDIYERQGVYGGEPPLVAGAEGAGTVAAVGEGVTEFSESDRVAWNAASGSYAESVVMPAGKAVSVPEGLSNEIAAASILQGMTAHYLTHSTYAVQAGDNVLVHAASGGMGRLLTQVVKMLGGRVIGTTSTEEKAELARRNGADDVIEYEGFAERIRELTDGEGVSVVYDGVGKATFDDSIASLRPRGYMVLYGAASGPVPAVEPSRLQAAGSLFLTRPTLFHYTLSRDELLERSGDIFDWVENGKLDILIGGRYSLEDARRAQEDIASRKTIGKLILAVKPGS